jgi:predicted DNA-binding transcriptional regulator AlpA
MPPDLVAPAEIARMIDVSRQRVDQLSRQKGFPDPYVVTGGRRLWLRSDVLKWAKANGRPVAGQ